MDPLTQGLLGAVAAQALFSRQLGRYAAVVGATAGMIADLDVLIRSSSDPLLGMVMHRGFTHSLAFIPLGAAIACLPFWWIKSLRYRRRAVFGAALAAYATHAPLDCLTSYGTMLFWPFSDYRVSLDCMPIIEPIFTALLLIGVMAALFKRSMKPARVALAMACFYVMLGAIQHQRAMNVQLDLADSRYHEISRQRVMPTLGNLVVWRSVYESRGRLVADQIRLPPVGPMTYRAGQVIGALDLKKWSATIPQDSLTARDVQRFAWFADQFIAILPDDPQTIGDMRYSSDAELFRPLWGVRFDPQQPQQHVRITHFRDRAAMRQSLRQLWQDILAPRQGDAYVEDIGLLDAPAR